MNEITNYPTLVDAISSRKERDPYGLACVFLSEDGPARAVDNSRFHDDMKQCALGLMEQGVGGGETVLLALDHDYGLIRNFWGAVCCGAVPSVMTYWRAGSDPDAYARKIVRLAVAVQARAVITLPELCPVFTAALEKTGCMVIEARDPDEDRAGMAGSLPGIEPGQTALMQFTSGTTGTPKAIRFSHRAVLDHIATSADTYRMTRDWVYVSWLPFYHDMGMIGHIRSLLHGGLLVSMSPRDWLRRPEMLLRAVHEYRGTLTNMPNFSFDYCTRRIRDEHLAGVDLGSWRVITNGAEPVLPESMLRFSERFKAYGLRENVFAIGYGMAENVCGISMTTPGQALSVDWVSAEGLHAQGRAVPVEPGSPGARAVVSCGYPYSGIDLAVMDDRGERLAEREVGEIAIRSNTLFAGYYRAPEAEEGAFHDGWFRTGDIGYVAGGQLHVCDRKKDLIISGGKNVHPHAIESIAAGVFCESAARCAAFGVSDPGLGTELPVLVIERRRQPDDAEERELILRVRRQVGEELDLSLADVRMVPRGWLVKTTSGKLARAASRKKYIEEGYGHSPREFTFSPEDLAPDRLHRTVIRLFEMVLGAGGVGPDDDFIRLGGDSLSALRLFIEIEERFGRNIPAAEFFQRPTVRHMVEILSRDQDGEASEGPGPDDPWNAEDMQSRPAGKPEMSLTDYNEELRETSLSGMKRSGFVYKSRLSFLTWLYGHGWARQMFKPGYTSLHRRFYALLENPVQSESDSARCALIIMSPGGIQKQLLNQLVLNKRSCWSLKVDMARLESAYRQGKGVIIAGRHAGIALLVRELALGRLKPNGYYFIKMAAGFLGQGGEALPPRELKRLRLSIFLDQLLIGKRVLSGGGIVFILPDAREGLSRGIPIIFHGRKRNFKTGFAELALETGSPVLPVSMGIDVHRREMTLAFLDPLDNGPGDTPHAGRVEGLVRQYAEFLREEWNRCPGSVFFKHIKAHLVIPPSGR